MQYISLLNSFWTKLKDIVAGIFAIIPQTMYSLYASAASLLDACQMLLRKLAGLDVYYVKDPSTGVITERSGDILTEFIEGVLGINQKYSALNTVFWSLVIFGVMLLVLSTIFAIIKAHYNYDSSKSNPMKIIGQSLKSLALMAITPLVVIFGVYLSEVTLRAVDSITAPNSTANISQLFESEAVSNIKAGSRNGDTTGKSYYTSFDMFSITEYTNTSTFSGLLFEFVAYNANRVRLGSYTALDTAQNNKWDSCDIFYSSESNEEKRAEIVADQIDFAFSNCLRLQSRNTVSMLKDEASAAIGMTLAYGPSLAYATGLIAVGKFSKFNVGLVWYYYDLWNFNFIIAFLGVGLFLMTLPNIIFGLMKRLVICVALFLVSAPVIGITPLDGGSGFTSWKKALIGYIIGAYGAIIGMNLFFDILPVLENISFFNVKILDKLFDILIIVAVFSMIKKFISLISSFIGGNDLNSEGEGVKSDVKGTATKALNKTMETTKIGVKMGAYAMTGGVAFNVGKGIYNRVKANKMVKEGKATDVRSALKMIRTDQNENRGLTNLGKKGVGFLKKKLTGKGGAFNRFMGSAGGQMLAAYLGLSEEDVDFSDEIQELDDKGNPVVNPDGSPKMLTGDAAKEERGKRRMAAALKRGLDIRGMMFKSFGQITGLNLTQEALVKAGVIDKGKEVVQGVGGAFGLNFDPKAKENSKSSLLTKEQKEQNSEDKKERQLKEVQDEAFESKRAADAVFMLTKAIKEKKK